MKLYEGKKSLVRRLRAIMLTIAAFSIIVFSGVYISSLSMLNGLTSINSSNYIFSLAAQSIEGIGMSAQIFEKLPHTKGIADIRFEFVESQKIIQQSISAALNLSQEMKSTHQLIEDAVNSNRLYNKSTLALLDKINNMPRQNGLSKLEVVTAELLVIQQFKMETEESLRKAQISLRARNDYLFTSIYENRFSPIIVATVLSLVFFTFIVTFGFSITRKLGRSIINLTQATEVVKEGDLSYSAPILEQDEIGNLTSAFNEMVLSLKEEKNQRTIVLERLSLLQEITASFSTALTVEQVFEVTVKIGFNSLGAYAGVIALLGVDDELELKRNVGVLIEEGTLNLKDQHPIAESLRYSLPIFIEDQQEIINRYPDLKDIVLKNKFHSWAFIPLEVASSKIGSLGIYFLLPRKFIKAERDFMIALGRQCAQAINRSQLYDEARVAVQSRDEFLSIASHELKTPLTPLKMQIQMLARQVQKGEKVSSSKLMTIISDSEKHIRRLTKLIDDLLDVSRITSGKLTLNYEKINLADLARDIIAQYSHMLKDVLKNIEISGSDNIECECDSIRLEQVLINLLTNAAKYAPDKLIKVHLERNNKYARISVIDQGPGIAPKDQARIFERFERVKGNENVGGLGLGLFISQQIVKAHQGEIWVKSKVGEGSAFIIEIPLVHTTEVTKESRRLENSKSNIRGRPLNEQI